MLSESGRATLNEDGAELIEAVLSNIESIALANDLEPHFASGPGARLFGLASVARLCGRNHLIGQVAETILGPKARAVRALAFDKTAEANWAVGWHQDRTIAVRARRETPGFGPWSVKGGVPHVEPPFAIMAEMITMRVHVDECGPGNAPLRVARGSHRWGRIASAEAAARAQDTEEIVCLAAAGDVWVYRTPVLHASRPSSAAGRRRVIQIDFSAAELPDGLEWAGIEA
jgi:hypothetical protein